MCVRVAPAPSFVGGSCQVGGEEQPVTYGQRGVIEQALANAYRVVEELADHDAPDSPAAPHRRRTLVFLRAAQDAERDRIRAVRAAAAEKRLARQRRTEAEAGARKQAGVSREGAG